VSQSVNFAANNALRGGKMKKYLILCALVAFGMMTVGSKSAFASFDAAACPALGNDTLGCELLITVTSVNGSGVATGFTTSTNPTDQGPFDGADDTLVGILNSSGATLTSISISGGTTDIFGFDGDGACVSSNPYGTPAADCLNGAYQSSDPGDYESVSATFSGINAAFTSGTVNVNVANGGTAWFSLEEAVTANQIAPSNTVPEPNSLILLGTGIVGLAGMIRRKLMV
jgi:hypothetical protein